MPSGPRHVPVFRPDADAALRFPALSVIESARAFCVGVMARSRSANPLLLELGEGGVFSKFQDGSYERI